MKDPKSLTRADVLRAASNLRFQRKMPRWRVIVNDRELPARPLVLEAAGVQPNNRTNSHQAVAILERLGFETRYAGAESESGPQQEMAVEDNQATVLEAFTAIATAVPRDEWTTIPADLAENVDHYLYGKKK